MTTYQITEEEVRLLDAAKRVCSLWGHHHGNLLTHRGGGEDADAALVQQLSCGTAVVNGQFVRDIVNHSETSNKPMTTVHVVATTVGGYAREDSQNVDVVGAYLNPKVADAVRKVAGNGATVTALELDFIPAGLVEAMRQFGIVLPTDA